MWDEEIVEDGKYFSLRFPARRSPLLKNQKRHAVMRFTHGSVPLAFIRIFCVGSGIYPDNGTRIYSMLDMLFHSINGSSLERFENGAHKPRKNNGRKSTPMLMNDGGGLRASISAIRCHVIVHLSYRTDGSTTMTSSHSPTLFRKPTNRSVVLSRRGATNKRVCR